MVKLIEGILLCGLVFCSSCQPKEELVPRFQNVVVIVSDDHTPGVTGCYGNKVVRTRILTGSRQGACASTMPTPMRPFALPPGNHC